MKTEVILDSIFLSHDFKIKGGDLLGPPFRDELASYQLVGGVMAYQGN